MLKELSDRSREKETFKMSFEWLTGAHQENKEKGRQVGRSEENLVQRPEA